MRPFIQEIATAQTPESLVEQLAGKPGIVLLRSAGFDSAQARYSFVAANPFLTFRSFGSRCEIGSGVPADVWRRTDDTPESPTLPPPSDGCVQFGNPWHLLDALMARYELLDEMDLPFPLGGCFGYWGYDLKNFTEPKLPRRAVNDLELPDCHVGFYDSLVVFDHCLGKTCVVATGLSADGSRSEARARAQAAFWTALLTGDPNQPLTPTRSRSEREREIVSTAGESSKAIEGTTGSRPPRPLLGERAGMRANVSSNISRSDFLSAVERAQRYIRAGDIYQVNLSQRLAARRAFSGWELFGRLLAVSPAPFAAYVDCGDFQIASSSPEQFLRLSGSHVTTRPIKGTRSRSPDATRDAQLAYELQTSPKELAELVMITDLLRNDLGRVCEFGSVQVPELAKLERFAQVQHLVSTVEGRLRTEVTHFAALASCFPGGSITGAPKFRAMEIIDELEPIARGPYCGCHGYLGFNRESQLSISIRTAICKADTAYFHVGAGIVADSNPEAEYEETLAKAAGFLAALGLETGSARIPRADSGVVAKSSMTDCSDSLKPRSDL
ncbi:MAG: anthranilate synthase component I family protein [Verrucomicrobia subdivision 3 bacterium]|nr:anthranilate synthase component I family protein [Limisphaerales bacterium]